MEAEGGHDVATGIHKAGREQQDVASREGRASQERGPRI